MADMVTLLNTIRENASTEYQNRVPEATRTNIAEVGNPIVSYSLTMNEFLNLMVNKIAFTLVRNKTFKNPLSVLKKGNVPLGQDIEELFTNIAKGEKYDPTGSELLKRKLPDTKVMYHRMNRQDQYTVTISRQQIKNAFTSYTELEKLVNTIVTSMYSGDNFDEFVLMKNLFASAITDGKITTVDVEGLTSAELSTEFVKNVKTISGYMQFPSSNFNKYYNFKPSTDTGDPITTWTPKENQILLLRTDVKTDIDVDVLAQAFNMDKVNFMSRVVEVDNFGSAKNCLGILMDESTIEVRDNLLEITDFYNGKGMYTNYYLNHWQTYSLSLFGNAVAFMQKESV